MFSFVRIMQGVNVEDLRPVVGVVQIRLTALEEVVDQVSGFLPNRATGYPARVNIVRPLPRLCKCRGASSPA